MKKIQMLTSGCGSTTGPVEAASFLSTLQCSTEFFLVSPNSQRYGLITKSLHPHVFGVNSTDVAKNLFTIAIDVLALLSCKGELSDKNTPTAENITQKP
jgi:hypothetical protein